MKKIGVIGAGKWGRGLQFALSQKNRVFITSRHKKDLADFVSLEEILELEYLVFVLPAQITRMWLEQNYVFKNHKVLVASKGIDAQTGEFLNQIYERHIPKENLGFLTGPSFAAEVMQSLPTALVVNSKNQKLALEFASLFPDFIKAYTSDDVIGAEVAGAYKNVIAIAGGICDGLMLGNNARASLLARGLVEMARFAEVFGGRMETFLGLSGAGDLFLTASSTLSRNYRVGLGLAKGKTVQQILEQLGEVAEGIATAEAIHKISIEHDIYTPVAREVHLVLSGKDPKESLLDLLNTKR